MRRRATEVLENARTSTSTRVAARAHSIAVQQLVAIARAMELDARVLILDEPTSSLDTREVDELFAVIERRARPGVAILFVTHFLDRSTESPTASRCCATGDSSASTSPASSRASSSCPR